MNNKTDFRKIWSELIINPQFGELQTQYIGSFKVHFGVEQVSSEIVPIIVFPNINCDPIKTRGFLVIAEKGNFGKDDPIQEHMFIKCLDSQLIPVFFRLIEEVFELILDGMEPASAIKSAIEAWKSLLEKPIGNKLGLSELTGLWGELNFLNQLLNDGVMPLDALDFWTGPDKNPWDFIIRVNKEIVFVEVKTTVGSKNEITVNNPKQLVIDAGKAWLCFFKVSQNSHQSSFLSLPGLISKILSANWAIGIQGAQFRSKFWEKLYQSGYAPEFEVEYSEFCFHQNEEDWYVVGSDFPVLRDSDFSDKVRNRISDLKYKLNLGGLKTFDRPDFFSF